MKETIQQRISCSDLNDHKIDYELYKETPDFTEFRIGEIHSLILKNTETLMLEEIKFRIVGGNHWPGTEDIRNIWGEILSDDMEENYSTLHFEYDCNGMVERTFAMRDTKSTSVEKASELSRRAKYAAEFTVFDPISQSGKS